MSERHALIDAQWTVVNVIVLDELGNYAPPEGLTLLPCPSHVGPDWRWVDDGWQAPESAPVRQVAASEFQLRFTDEELASIQTSLDPQVIRLRTWVQTVGSDIDLDDERVVNGLAYLVAIDLLSEDRANQIRQ